MEPMIVARGVSRRFALAHNRTHELKQHVINLLQRRPSVQVEEFWALRNVSATIGRGDVVGVLGRNGSGKSTFLKVVAGLLRPTSGQLLVRRGARIGTMIELGVGFHPLLTGHENVRLNASIHGLSRREIDELYPRVVAYSGLEHFMDVALQTYSSGMQMRLAFAIAASSDPDILLLDEVFAVGDAAFQQQCADTVRERCARGKTVLFVSHSPHAVRALCHRLIVLEHGSLVFDGSVEEGLAFYGELVDRDPGVVGSATA
jgi:ABC-2 type transport system ATP-binding protein